jgi:hypothetical protein
VDVHHFNLLDKLRETASRRRNHHPGGMGTDAAGFAVHNYEDRSQQEIISHELLYLGHFPYSPRQKRRETGVGADEVLGHFEERFGTAGRGARARPGAA